MTRWEKADMLRKKDYNCAQCLLAAFEDLTGLPRETSLAIAGGLGGGIGGCQAEVCGALSGAVLVLGMMHPHNEEDPAQKAATGKLVKEFVSRFSARFNDKVNCRDPLQEKDLQPVPEVAELGATKHCETLIVSAVAMLYDYLEELSKE